MKKVSLILSAVVTTAMMLSSCGGASIEEGASTEVTIGTQVWMTNNLNVATFRNGDPIPEAKSKDEWLKAVGNKQPAWCYLDNNPIYGKVYGKLYNLFAVNDPRGLAPEGWKVPSKEDWSRLIDFLGGESLAGQKMKSKYGWWNDGNGTNSSGFAGLPSGGRDDDGPFFNKLRSAHWWRFFGGQFKCLDSLSEIQQRRCDKRIRPKGRIVGSLP